MEVKVIVSAEPAPGNPPMRQALVNGLRTRLNNKVVTKSVDAATAVKDAGIFAAVVALAKPEEQDKLMLLRYSIRGKEVDASKSFTDLKVDARTFLECEVLIK